MAPEVGSSLRASHRRLQHGVGLVFVQVSGTSYGQHTWGVIIVLVLTWKLKVKNVVLFCIVLIPFQCR